MASFSILPEPAFFSAARVSPREEEEGEGEENEEENWDLELEPVPQICSYGMTVSL